MVFDEEHLLRRNMDRKQLKAVPLELKEANEFVSMFHRHHKPVHRDKFRFGCMADGKLVGVVQCARPVNRVLDDGKTLEIVRLCTYGTWNVCSFLYSRAAKIAKIMGYNRVITYTLEEENGASLKASGFTLDGLTKGGKWTCPSRPRKTESPTQKKKRWVKYLQEGVNYG